MEPMLTLDTNIAKIAGIGPKMAQRLERLGIEKVSDLLFYFPARYDDFSKVIPIGQMRPTRQMGPICIKGRILQIKNQRSPKGKMFLTHALISDDSGSTKAVWFNQPFLTKVLKKGDEVLLAGKVEYGIDGLSLVNPSYERIIGGEPIHVGRIVPVYSETEGLNSKFLRRIIKPLLFLTNQVPEFLPEEIKKRQNLISLGESLRQIHFPDSFEAIDKARKRLAFDELFLIQLKLLKMKKDWQENKAPKMKFDATLVKSLVSKLPFKLTNAQRRAAWEIIGDLTGQMRPIRQMKRIVPPMNRLLEGDVGSGKTVVAAIAMLVVAKNGFQSVLMAPTEILAFQHFNNLVKLLEGFGVSVGLLTAGKNELSLDTASRKQAVDFPGEEITARARSRSSCFARSLARSGRATVSSGDISLKISKSDLIKKIKEGEVDIIVGTHALIQEKMKFKKLGLAIIDEQHRFGVKQRALLRQKATPSLHHSFTPHLLSMSATPIPRTLSLALYGDLDLSILDEMPPGRQKISTHLVPPTEREKAYEFIKKQIKEGRQAFVICPLIEESDKLGVKAATEEYEKLKKEVFADLKIGLLHGKMKSKEKERIMADFKNKKFDILVSTAVVEVGVDIPNATIMMIEGAERFGLAQLHQFRGRVGRGEHKSYCFIFTEMPSDKTYKRLEALVNLHDGFQLAEKDLEIRGPGELYGIRQHGFWDLKMASLSDRIMISKAREEAEKIIEQGLGKYPALVEKLEEFERERRLE
jgi:ATP-dependent DNA helicase RecG